jgi:ATP adenylyltransferase
MESNPLPGQLGALWAPWRVEYFEVKPAEPDFLATAANATDDAAHLVLSRGRSAFLIMNRYPYAVGHLMAVPYRKVAELSELTDAEKLELWQLAETAQDALRRVMRAEGFNLGLNLGSCAGAGLADHLHLHIVPRWANDQNFMPILAQTRIIPEGLMPLYEKLLAALSHR